MKSILNKLESYFEKFAAFEIKKLEDNEKNFSRNYLIDRLNELMNLGKVFILYSVIGVAIAGIFTLATFYLIPSSVILYVAILIVVISGMYGLCAANGG